MDTKTETQQTYERTALQMAKKFAAIGPRVADIERAFSYSSVAKPRVIEIGCGNGRDATAIIERTDHYLGIDYAAEMIAIARHTAPTAQFLVADLETFNFPAGTDVIFAFASLLHSPRETVAHVLARAYAALNPRGIIYISLKYGDYHAETRSDDFGTRTFYFYTPELIKELAGSRFVSIWEDTQELKEKWFTLVLQKV